MKKILNTILSDKQKKKLFQFFFEICPDDFKQEKGFLDTFQSLKNLKQIGFNPTYILDVGAYEGIWTKKVQNIFPGSHFVMFEAQTSKEAFLKKLKSNKINYHITLLGPEEKNDIIFHEMETGSSILKEQSDHSSNAVTLKMKPLDNFTETITSGTFLKLDVQGFELEVLKGASKTLSYTDVILLETSLLDYNEGAPLTDEIISFLKEKGFVILDFCEMVRKRSDCFPYQIDILFIKKDHPLRKKINQFGTWPY